MNAEQYASHIERLSNLQIRSVVIMMELESQWRDDDYCPPAQWRLLVESMRCTKDALKDAIRALPDESSTR